MPKADHRIAQPTSHNGSKAAIQDRQELTLRFMIIRLGVYGARIADHLQRNPQQGNGPRPAASPGWPKDIGLPCSGADIQAVFEYFLRLILAEITTTLAQRIAPHGNAIKYGKLRREFLPYPTGNIF